MVEVADSTLNFDLGTKIPLYARAGLVEAWVVDLQQRAVRVFRDPGASGYLTSFTASGNESIGSVALPAVVLGLPDIFPA